MKDNFDLRSFLAENKLTQATRTEKKKFGSIMLNEMVMAADPDAGNAGYMADEDDPFESEGPAGLDSEEVDESLYDMDPDRDSFEAWCRDAGIRPESEGAREEYELDKERELGECGDMGALEEAGYTDDEDDDIDIDSPEIPYDPRAERAAKKAMGPDTDTGSDDPDAEREDSDGDFEDPEDLGAELGGDGEVGGEDLAADMNFGPDVEMEMDNDELNEYLHEFRRPEVAKKVLERAIRTAQRELRESPGIKFLYLILKDGFYKTTKFQNAGRLIAKINQNNPDQGIE